MDKLVTALKALDAACEAVPCEVYTPERNQNGFVECRYCGQSDDTHALIAAARAVLAVERETPSARVALCIYCAKALPVDQADPEQAYAVLREHDQSCERNPLVIRLVVLQQQFDAYKSAGEGWAKGFLEQQERIALLERTINGFAHEAQALSVRMLNSLMTPERLAALLRSD